MPLPIPRPATPTNAGPHTESPRTNGGRSSSSAGGRVYAGGTPNFNEQTGTYKPGTTPTAPKGNTPANMNGHAAPGVPNRAGEYRGQAINAGTTYRYSDPHFNPNPTKPNVSDKLAEITSQPSAPKISAKDATARDTRLHQENTARTNIQENNSYQSSVEKNIKTFKDNEYRTSNPGVNRYPNGTTPRATVVGGNPKYINGNVEGPSLKSGGFKGAKGGILGAIPLLLEGGKIMSGQSNPNYIPKSQREG